MSKYENYKWSMSCGERWLNELIKIKACFSDSEQKQDDL